MSVKMDILKQKEGVYTITLTGSLDSAAYNECDQKVNDILRKPAKVLIFDLKDLDYIGSLGFSILIKSRRVLEEGGGFLGLVHLKPEIRKIFEVVKIMPDRLFTSMEEAEACLKKTLK
jgi:anti-anti-sigma factor